MDDGLPIVPGLLLFVVLLGLNALFVAAEFAYVTVRPSQMRNLASSGNPRARTVLKALDNLDFYVAASQLGITMATIAIGFLGEPVIAALIEPPAERLVGSFAPAISHSIAIAVAFGIVTGLHIVVGEFMPKTVALQSPDKTTLWLSLPMELFVRIFRPLIWLLNESGNGVLRLLGIRVRPVSEETLQAEDIAMTLESSASAGLISRRELDLTRNTLRLSTLTAENLMVPRSEITAIPAQASGEDVRRAFATHRFTRFPVYDGTLDNIIGVVDVKHTVFDLAQEHDWRTGLEAPVMVPVSMSVDQTIRTAREANVEMVVLVDEYGGTAGILTLFDVIQYLAGGLPDEHQRDHARLQRRPDGSYVLSGLLPVIELEDELGINLPVTDAHTAGGLVMELLGHVPARGDQVDIDGYRLIVAGMDERRVDRIVLRRYERGEQR